MESGGFTWQDAVALIVTVVWAISFVAPLFVKGYIAPFEVHLVFLMVLGALGFTTPKN